MNKIKEKIVILYDGDNCSDGFSSAWVAWKKFGNKAKYIGVLHQQPIPYGLENKIIYMIDFTYPENIVRGLIRNNISVTAIDHHIYMKETVKLTENYSFSLKNSGCVLAWKLFFPINPMPKLLKYIEDTDLWRHKLPHSREIFAYLMLYDFNFKNWDIIAKKIQDKKQFKTCLEIGRAILKYESRMVELLFKSHVEKIKIDGHVALAVNSPFYANELGNKLAEKSLFGIVWRIIKGELHVSLRSIGKKFDVAKLAKKFGGGGHKTSSGFIIKGYKLPWKTVK